MASLSSSGWIDVEVRTTADAGELLTILQDRGAVGVWEGDGWLRLYWPAIRWEPDTVEVIRQAIRGLASDHTQPGAAITVRTVPDTDWNARWAASVVPIRIGHRIVIRPSWKKVVLGPGDIELVVDPKQAFGTGHHATTKLLREWEETLIHGGERVLDLGTGSGILAMAALRLGAGVALAMDLDSAAIGCAREYARLNGFGAELQFVVGTLEAVTLVAGAPFDLVLANLDCQTLVHAAPRLAPQLRRGARLLVSGLLFDDRLEVCRAFGEQGGTCRSVRERDGWLALEILMAEGCEGG